MIAVQLGEICTEGLQNALEVLEQCKVETPCWGFTHPFFAPGGQYGVQWWHLDGAVALDGYKWIDQKTAENAVRNFMAVQRPDGRIPLWGADEIPAFPTIGRPLKEVSSLPELLRAAAKVARRSKDPSFVAQTDQLLRRNLDWWLSQRQDPGTGLLTAVFEETFRPWLGEAGEYAPVDTNVEMALGCQEAAGLAEHLGFGQEAREYREKGRRLMEAVQRYLWEEKTGFFHPYLVKEGRRVEDRLAESFYALGDPGLLPERKRRLLSLLTDPKAFGWGNRALTSVALDDPGFTVTHGEYQGNPSWSGMVWSLINYNVVCALEMAGESGLAAELAYHTLRVFDHNCVEFADPFDGSGHGVKAYAWTAAHYLLLMVEHLFGVSYDAWADRVTVRPNLPLRLLGREAVLEGLPLPCGGLLSVRVDPWGRVSCQLEGAPEGLELEP